MRSRATTDESNWTAGFSCLKSLHVTDIVHTMNLSFIESGLFPVVVLLSVWVIFTTLGLLARAKKWKPTPLKPIWALLFIVVADVVAGVVSSIVSEDIHWIYWWLLGLPIVAVVFPIMFVFGNLFVRIIWVMFLRLFFITVHISDKCRRKH